MFKVSNKLIWYLFSSVSIVDYEQVNVSWVELCKTSVMQLFVEILNGIQPINIFAKSTMLNAWQGSEYASDNLCWTPNCFSATPEAIIGRRSLKQVFLRISQISEGLQLY